MSLTASTPLHPLITEALIETEKYFCPFLERGYCREGSRCNFSHDNHESIKIPNDYCHFYLANQCLYGQDCKFRHIEPISNNGPSNSDRELVVEIETDNEDGLYHQLPIASKEAQPYEPINNQLFEEMSYRFSSSLPSIPTEASHWDDKLTSCRSISHGDTVSAHLMEMYANEIFHYTQMGLNEEVTSIHNNATSTGINNSDSKISEYHVSNNNNYDGHDDLEPPQLNEQSPSYSEEGGRRREGNIDTYHEQSTSKEAMTTTNVNDLSESLSDSNRQNISSHLIKSGPRCPATSLLFDSKNQPSSSSTNTRLSNSSSNLDNISEKFKTSSLTSYAKICKGKNFIELNNDPKKDYPLCPYSSTAGICQFPPGQCIYLHGLDCDLCGRSCLHPYNLDQQRQHREDCLREHEREMELSFAVQRSRDKVCGICMDTVVEKKPITSSRFGILEKCNHIFCLGCIRKWRGTKQFETRTIRACPECRVSSDFVVPSKYWVEDQDDKEKLIQDYKAALRSKPCKYFDEGKGECPFAGSCFYKHAYPDGRIAKMDTPKPRRRVYGARGPASTVANYILWNILTSTDDDDWSNDELESLYLDPDYGTTDDEDIQDDDLDGPYNL